VLKAIGYTDGEVLSLVLFESLFITFIGGGLGLTIGWLAIQAGDPTKGALPIFFFPTGDILFGVLLIFMVGAVAGLLPAIQAMRLDTASALRSE